MLVSLTVIESVSIQPLITRRLLTIEIMDNKIRCQSCGMPLSKDFGNPGTTADNSNTEDFCIFCFKNGAFTNPIQTMDEMIQSSIKNMTTDLQMPLEQAINLANSFIPNLRRWQK